METECDSDAPEELTLEQGMLQNEHIRKIQIESTKRVIQEGKEKRRKRALKKMESKSDKKSLPKSSELETTEDALAIRGMIPNSIVNFLASREKQFFLSDSEEEVVNHKPTKLRKKQKSFGCETVLLKEILPAQRLKNSMDFLKLRKMKVSRSKSVLKNGKQALRLLKSTENLLSKS